MEEIKKYKVIFWLITGKYEETVEAKNENEAKRKIYDKHKGKFCQVDFAYRTPLDKW